MSPNPAPAVPDRGDGLDRTPTAASARPAIFTAVLLALSCTAANADPGVVQCTYGGDDEHVTLEVYDTQRASLRGALGASAFQCAIAVRYIRPCRSHCKIPFYFQLFGTVDVDSCTATPADLDLDFVGRTLSLHVTPRGHRLHWHGMADSPCTSFRIDPEFARAHAAEGAVAERVPDELGAYAGRYPHDAIGGVTFLDHPLLRAAVARMGDDPALLQRLFEHRGPAVPIRRRGDRLFLSTCQAHDCLAHHWTLETTVDGGDARACRYDGRAAPGTTLWYRAGSAPEQRAQPCPDWD